MTEAPTPYGLLGSGDLGWCEVCEERPATQRARFVDARICASCAEGEPGEKGDVDG